MKQVHHLLGGLLVASCLSGCWMGTRSYVEAEDSLFPVSMGGAVYDEAGKPVSENELEKMRTFKVGYRTCNMLFSLLPLWNRTYDIGDDVNEQVKTYGGEAVTNLSVESNLWAGEKATMILPMLHFFTLGIMPDCNTVIVRGDIVRRPPAAL